MRASASRFQTLPGSSDTARLPKSTACGPRPRCIVASPRSAYAGAKPPFSATARFNNSSARVHPAESVFPRVVNAAVR